MAKKSIKILAEDTIKSTYVSTDTLKNQFNNWYIYNDITQLGIASWSEVMGIVDIIDAMRPQSILLTATSPELHQYNTGVLPFTSGGGAYGFLKIFYYSGRVVAEYSTYFNTHYVATCDYPVDKQVYEWKKLAYVE